MVLNNCVPDTMRNSSQSAGLIFGIEFELNQKQTGNKGLVKDMRENYAERLECKAGGAEVS